MEKTIPARTVIVCDRCREEVTRIGDYTRIEVDPNYNNESCTQSYDLCRTCMDNFTQFMSNER